MNACAKGEQPRLKHLTLSTVAFLVWTYSIGGLWHELGLYRAAPAAMGVVFLSLASGFIVPRPGEP